MIKGKKTKSGRSGIPQEEGRGPEERKTTRIKERGGSNMNDIGQQKTQCRSEITGWEKRKGSRRSWILQLKEIDNGEEVY